jgi:pantetheine-phosphate adenylyltransferase
MSRAVYPGTFDPVTLGHLDVLERGLQLFDEIVVGVAAGHHKKTLFDLEERLEMIREFTDDRPHVAVEGFGDMAVDFARRHGSHVILRGIRTVSDFEYEFQMALTNRTFAGDIETVFVMTSPPYSFLSARLVKESAMLGQDVTAFVPESVGARLRAKLRPAAGSDQ